MNQQDIARVLVAIEARLVGIERRLQDLGDRSHDLVDVLNGIGLKTQVLWDEWKERRGRQ